MLTLGCAPFADCSAKCQRLNWADHKLSCTSHARKRNRAEETSLAQPLGSAFFLDSTSRWRDEIWVAAFEGLLNSYLFTPKYLNDLALVTITLEYQPDAPDLLSQWRPRPLEIAPLSSIDVRTIPTEILDKLPTLCEKEPPTKDPNGRLCGPWRIMLISHVSASPGKGSAMKDTGFGFFGINRISGGTPCARDPANVNLDWPGAVFSFLQSTSPSCWKDDETAEKYMSAYLTRQNDEFGTLAQAHWERISPDERAYFAYYSTKKNIPKNVMVSRAYMFREDYDECDWIPRRAREMWERVKSVGKEKR
ncbi:hypothetical protein RQP46_002401 [Phenoliferia psychrophenolica]